MVTFLYGRAGVGKTNQLFLTSKQIAKNGGKVIFVVPEQLSMTFESKLSKTKGRNISVLNFGRLTDTIFRTLGKTARKTPDSAMSAAAVCLAVEKVYNQLTYYKSIAHTNGFVTKLIEAFSDFDQNCLSFEKIMAIPSEQMSSSTRDKYTDLFKIYNEYKQIWSGDNKAPDSDIEVAAGLLELNDMFADTDFFFDGFHGYTEKQLILLTQIISQAKSCTFTFTTDLESEVFSTITAEQKRLARLCEKCGVQYCLQNAGLTNLRQNSNELLHIEKYGFGGVPSPSIANDGAITVYSAKNLNDELSFIACKIKNDVLSGKYRYNDIAVLVPNADSIATVASTLFEKYNLPCYIDKKSTLITKPITAFVTSAIEIALDGFEFESVFALLKTGLCDIPFDDISRFENYVRMWKIRPRSWGESEWTYSPFGISNRQTPDDTELLKKINDIKNYITTPLAKFKSRLEKANTCREKLSAIVLFCENFNVSKNLENIAKRLYNRGDMQGYEDTLRLYGTFMSMLDSIDTVLGDTQIDSDRLSSLISVCCSQITVSTRPARADEVVFAGVGRVRAQDKKCIYIPCLNADVIPAPMSDSSLITQADKQLFLNNNIHITKDFLSTFARERFDLYSAISSASNELVMSYSAFTLTGEKRLKSTYLENILKIIDVTELTEDSLPDEFYLVSLSSASDLAARGKVAGLVSVINEICGFAPKRDKLSEKLTDDIVYGLYSKNLHLSFSGIEEYIGCPFKFFLNRGLKISKTEPVELNPANIGTFIHHGLERLLSNPDIKNADDKKVLNTVKEISDEYYNLQLKDLKNRSRRFDYLFSKASTALEGAAVSVVGELKNSKFTPFDFEVDISQYIKPCDLDKGYTLSLVGSIDRVDITPDGSLGKIVDYKSGSQKFSLKKIYNGISMQLPIYAGAVRAKHTGIEIAAMYYLRVGIPQVEAGGTKGLTESEYLQKVSDYYTRDGIFLEGDTLSYLDNSGKYFAKIKRERVVDSEKMNRLIDFTLDKIKETGNEIVNGNMSVSPINDSDVQSCRYCDYKAICKISEHTECERKLEEGEI